VLTPGRPLSPDLCQQAGTRNDLVRVQQEDGEDRALFPASQDNRLAVDADLQRPEKPELHAPPRIPLQR
jgi:hypothetical protein